MKRVTFLLINILIISFTLYAIKRGDDFSGNACFSNEDDLKAIQYADYSFIGNMYSFSLTVYGRWKDVLKVPDHLIDRNNNYYEKGTWRIEKKCGFEYLLLKSNNDFTIKKRLGILYHPKKLLLYDKDMLFFDSNEGLRFGELMPRVVGLKMSSFLKEGKIEYKGNNFYEPYREKLKPWVEGVKGQGIGEWIDLSTDSYRFPVSFFLISNGYVSFEKPYLYKKNSRIKKMRITSKEENIDFVVELQDTPNFQEVRLPKKITNLKTTFRFTIEEVYPGTQWEDTCLNLIIPLGDLPE